MVIELFQRRRCEQRLVKVSSFCHDTIKDLINDAANQSEIYAVADEMATRNLLGERDEHIREMQSDRRASPLLAATTATALQSSTEPTEQNQPVKSSFEDAMLLQSHAQDWAEADKKEWQRHIKFLLKHMATCFDSMPTADELLGLISALESNGFGLFSAKGQLFGRGAVKESSSGAHAAP